MALLNEATDLKDYYIILGVRSDSTSAEIKKNYRKLALEKHPDKNPNDPEATEAFKKLGEAYAVLGNESRRSQYDSTGFVEKGDMVWDADFYTRLFEETNDDILINEGFCFGDAEDDTDTDESDDTVF